jgi:predicted nucleic acid-binding protein
MKYLLDVNVLLAAIWVKHAQHSQAKAWLEDKEVALCPVSELGFIRISTNQRAFGFAMHDARLGLEKFAADLNANTIPDDLPALASHPRTSDQVTDHYLADLAAKHGLKLATLDGQLKHPSVELVR